MPVQAAQDRLYGYRGRGAGARRADADGDELRPFLVGLLHDVRYQCQRPLPVALIERVLDVLACRAPSEAEAVSEHRLLSIEVAKLLVGTLRHKQRRPEQVACADGLPRELVLNRQRDTLANPADTLEPSLKHHRETDRRQSIDLHGQCIRTDRNLQRALGEVHRIGETTVQQRLARQHGIGCRELRAFAERVENANRFQRGLVRRCGVSPGVVERETMERLRGAALVSCGFEMASRLHGRMQRTRIVAGRKGGLR